MKLNLAQKVLYNVGAQALGRAAGLVVGLLTIRATTGYLGVDAYGELAIVLALTGLLLSISDFGISTVLARELARSPGEANELGGGLLGFRLVSAGGAVVAAAVAVPFLPYSSEVKVGLLIGLLGTFFYSVGRYANAFFQVNLRMDLLSAIDVFQRAASLLLIVVVAVLDLGFYALVASVSLASLIFLGTNFAVSRRFWTINLRRASKRTRRLVRDSVGLWLVTLVGLLHLQGGMILLSLLQQPAEVGIYSIAYRFMEQSLLVPGILMATVFPILARRIHENRERSDVIVMKTLTFLLLQAIPLTLLLFVLADDLVGLAAAPEFGAAAEPLRVVSLALPAIFGGTVFIHILIALNRRRALFVVALASLVVNLGLNLIFIPQYSYMGAAWATVASEAFAFVAAYFAARRAYALRLDYALLARLAVPTLLAVGVVAVAEATALSAVAATAAGLTAFFAGVFAARIVTRDDLRLFLGR